MRQILGDFPSLEGFASAWWAFLTRGLFALLVGATTLVLPGLPLMTVVVLYGLFVFVDGMTTFWVGSRIHAWHLIAGGVLGLAMGVYILLVSVGIHISEYPRLTAIALLYFIAAWAVIRGILEIGSAMQLRKEVGNEWVLLTSGIVSVIFGILFIANPWGAALRIIGAYGCVYGGMITIFAVRVRRLRRFYLDQER